MQRQKRRRCTFMSNHLHMKRLTALTVLLICLTAANAQEKNIYITGTVRHNTDSILVFNCNDADPITQSSVSTPYPTKIRPDGSFSITLKARRLRQWCITNGGDALYIVLHPGDRLRLNITGFNTYFDYKAEGRYANDANFEGWLDGDSVYQHTYVSRNYTALIGKKEDSAILAQLKEQSVYELNALNRYNAAHPLSPAFYAYRKAQFTYKPYNALQARTNRADTALFLKKLLNDDEAAGVSSTYLRVVTEYFWACVPARVKSRQATWADRLNAVDSLFTGRTRQLLLCFFLTMMPLDEAPPLFMRPEGKPYLKYITDQDFVYELDYAKAEYEKAVALTKASAEQADQHPSLDALLAEYKGKAVYVDFWASWCVPCRQQIPYSHRMEAKYHGKDIVFVYLAVSDGKASWLKARADLDMKGAQHLLNEKEGEEARKEYGVLTIPHYLIIDKNGKVVDANAPRPGEGKLLEDKLNAVLEPTAAN